MSTTNLNIFCDIRNKKFVQSSVNASPFVIPTFKTDEAVTLKVYVLDVNPSGGVSAPYTILATSGITIQAAIGSANLPLAGGAISFAEDSVNKNFTGVLNLDTSAMDTAMSGATAAGISRIFEVKIIEGGYATYIHSPVTIIPAVMQTGAPAAGTYEPPSALVANLATILTNDGNVTFTQVSNTFKADCELGELINARTAATIADADEIGFVDVSDSNTGKKTTLTNFKAFVKTYWDSLYVFATQITALTAKSTPVDADVLGITDSAASHVGKKTTFTQAWTNYFKAKADALYLALSGGTMTGTLVLAGTESSGSHAASRTYAAAQGTAAIAEAAAGAAILYAPLAGATFTGAIGFSGTTHPGIKLLSLTTAQRDALSSPQNGWMIYDSTLGYPVIYYGGAWNRVQTGTPGVGDMVLADVQTVTGAKTFGSAGAVGKLKLAGTTSGATTLDAEATASGTVTVPAGTHTLASVSLAQTLTNKTLTAPIITKPAMNATDPTAGTYAPSGGGTATLTCDLYNQHRITMPAGNITIAVSGDTNAQAFIVSITQDGTGSRTVTWFSTIRWAGGSAPTLTTTANKRDVFGFIRTGSGTYDGFILGQNL